MSIRIVSRLLVTVLVPLAFLASFYLYLYPLFHGCAFPLPSSSPATSWHRTLIQHAPFLSQREVSESNDNPPFRLLVLADPQLEGDSSLPDPEDGLLSKLAQHRELVFNPHQTKAHRKKVIKTALREIFFDDIPEALKALQKRIDLFGNDYYLAHVFRTLRWWTKPSHITVLGDLIGSQWVTDEEFDYRAWRYWNRVFTGTEKFEHPDRPLEDSSLSNSTDEWTNRLINVAGNHDIGYAGDISTARLARFERNFGRPDWDVRFNLPTKNSATSPSLHLIVLNDLLLDTPAINTTIQSQSYDFLNHIITQRSHPVEDTSSFTLLLTHVPLHKPQGVCVDAPFFGFHEEGDAEKGYESGGLREQNHLSDHASRVGVLEGIYGMSKNRAAAGKGMGRRGLILTGHDHEGCDVWHYLPHLPGPSSTPTAGNENENTAESPDDGWHTVPYASANRSASYTGIREITLRSMMGHFGGNAGLLSLWFDEELGEWRFEAQMCPLGVQHIWWGVHALDLVAGLSLAVWSVFWWCGTGGEEKGGQKGKIPKLGKEIVEKEKGGDTGKQSKVGDEKDR